MSRRDDRVTLQQMRDHAKEAIELSERRSRADLDTDRMFGLAMMHLVEIVGEAASRMSQNGRQRIPGIPWQEVVGTRNRIIHGYDEIDNDLLWGTLRSDLPELVTEIDRVLAEWPRGTKTE